ncbi:MAG TPA: recombinase family protein [Bryobacteraceae bacterium]|jgi:DNA invertase Pin-like site-specific DNA recombinase|nr:recombinase family protein [Bryobacteraceae bacterium]
MTDVSKIQPSHIQRAAVVYIRQSTPGQVEHNRESTARQYALADRACELGWSQEQVVVIDEDLGLSGSSTDKRSGFARLTSEVALAHVGIVLGLEVSRLARNNADWYRLLELCGVTDTLIGDNDGVYHPALFNDRLLLGLKGTMSEAELHIIRARLDGGIRNKAARGELRRGLPVGFIWGEQDGEVLFHPDEAVTGAIRTVFERFAEFGSARRVWLWFRSEGLSLPLQQAPAGRVGPIRWVTPTYTAVHHILTNPVYAGAYTYGKTRYERYVDEHGTVRKRIRHLPIAQWAVLIPEHHPGFIDWEIYQANQARLDSNTRPKPHQSGGAVREGAALLQGIATCGHCGRRLMTHYRGRNSTPGYHCAGKDIVDGRGQYCLTIGGLAIEQAVADAFLEAITPAAVEAMRLTVEQLQTNHDAALSQWRLEVERTHYEAERAERRYRTVEPENRLVARGLETEWESRLRDLAAAEAELRRREQQRPSRLDQEQLKRIQILGSDIRQVWQATTTTDRDRKELLRTLVEEVALNLKRAEGHANLTLRWRGGAITILDVSVPRFKPMGPRTDEDTISLLRRLAALYPDEVIAGILNRQGRKTASGERFTANQVGSLRRYRDIPRFQPATEPPNGELVSIRKAAQILGMNTSSIHRWLADGFIAGEQVTPGAPWQIRITDELRARIVQQEPPGYLPMMETTIKLGVSRQTVLQRVKRGELEAVLVRQGRRKGLRIKVVDQQSDLFGAIS